MAIPGLAPGIPGAQPGESFNDYVSNAGWTGTPQEYTPQTYSDYQQAVQYANQVQTTDTAANNPWTSSQNIQGINHNSGFLPDNYFNPGSQVATYNLGAGQKADAPQYTPNTPSAPSTTGSQTSTPAYPAMTNSYGLGSTPQPSGPSLAAPAAPMAAPSTNDTAVNSLTSAITDSGSKGMNPWSLQGESNARGGAAPATQ